MKKIIIAIDGFSGCGKSTMAKDLAQRLRYLHIDTGAMYRAVTLFFLRQNVDLNNPAAVHEALQQLEIRFETTPDGDQRTVLNGEVVEEEIRTLYVSQQVSQVSAIPAVRRAMVAQQQKMGSQKGVILEGRDIGTVVFPNAELKIFMTANPTVRTLRRLSELQAKGQNLPFEEVQNNLLQRDQLDASRADSPLRKASDARTLDNSDLSRTDQLELAFAWATEAILSDK